MNTKQKKVRRIRTQGVDLGRGLVAPACRGPITVRLTNGDLDAVATRVGADLAALSAERPPIAAGTADAAGGRLAPSEAQVAETVIGLAKARPEIFGQAVLAATDGGDAPAPALDFAAAEVALARWEALRRLGEVLDEAVAIVSAARREAGDKVRAVSIPAYAIASAVARVDAHVAHLLGPATALNHRAAIDRKRRERPALRLRKQQALLAEASVAAERAVSRKQRLAQELPAVSAPRDGARASDASAASASLAH